MNNNNYNNNNDDNKPGRPRGAPRPGTASACRSLIVTPHIHFDVVISFEVQQSNSRTSFGWLWFLETTNKQTSKTTVAQKENKLLSI